MSQDTQAGPVPTLGDASNVPANMLALASALGPQLCPPFASVGDRDAAALATDFKVCTIEGVQYVKQDGEWYSLGAAPQLITVGQNGQSIPSGNTFTTIAWSSAPRKVGDFAFAAGASSISVPIAGWYAMSLTVTWPNSAAGDRRVAFTAFTDGSVYDHRAATGNAPISVSGEGFIPAGSSALVRVYQTSGAAMNAAVVLSLRLADSRITA